MTEPVQDFTQKAPYTEPPDQRPDNRDLANSLTVLSQSRQWMQEQYRRMVWITVISLCFSCVSFLGNIVQFAFRPKPQYFAQTPDLRITEIIPLDEPLMQDEGVINWTIDVTTKTLSLDFLHWRDDLRSVKGFFTDKAFTELVSSLRDVGTIELLEAKRLNMNTSLQAAAILGAKGPDQDNTYSWRVEFPLMISYESSQGRASTQKVDAVVLVQRVSTLESPVGIKIKQLVLKPSVNK